MSSRGVKAEALDCDNVVNEFWRQSCYYLRSNTLEKGMNFLILRQTIPPIATQFIFKVMALALNNQLKVDMTNKQ